jgi:PAS domain S-box-containing protein
MARMELKRQQEQLRLQEQYAEYNERRFKALFEHSGGYLYTHSLSGEILSMNPATEQAMQYGKQAAVGRSIADFLVLDNPGALSAYLKKISAAGVMSGIVKVRTATGVEKYWQYTSVLCTDTAQEPFAICSAQDVTQKEVAQQILLQAEEELKSQVQLRTAELSSVNATLESTREELEAFLYRASHDLRGPVCSLRGIMHLLRREGTAHNQETLMGMMEQTVLKLEHAMESILHYTNNQHNYLDVEQIDLSLMVGQAIEYSRRVKGFERVRIELDIQAAYPFYSDAYRVQLVIQQLLANSIAFQDLTIPDPFVRISLSTSTDKVTICLQDNGVGVPPQTVPLIFDRFVKASGQSIGCGLGLYIVKEVLTKLRGSVEVTSIEGKGTYFVVEVPNQQQV